MPKQKVDEQTIIIEALKLFRKKSYFNTSMSDIADACGLQKGSLYHYFPSKEDLMKRVIKTVHEYFKNNVFHHAYDKNLPPHKRLENLFRAAEKVFLDEEKGNLLGNMGVETALMAPEFNSLVQRFFLDFFHAIKTIYQDKYGDKIANELAERSVAEIEGSLMFSRVFNDHSYLKNTTKRILKRIEEKPAEAAGANGASRATKAKH
ncbi:MAG: TetR/AcrR family transcriptional regulator [Chitinophagales bacterium]|nr:TetR/AcrR family transcriptional regulator [Chitinophagales bacterium]MDW8418429.1 TetR/AcrR family transcriptional regulator [Chitinophagales bacterium]